MTYWEKELEEIEKGCGKDLGMSYPEGNSVCGKECFGCLEIHLCSKCQARKSQLIRDQEEHKKKMEELKEKLKKEIEKEGMEDKGKLCYGCMYFSLKIIDKLFTEVVGK